MARQVRETVWLGRDNTIEWVLQAAGAAVADLSAVTKVWIDIGGTLVKSEDAPTAIWWTEQGQHQGITVDLCKLRLGGQSLAPGAYGDCRLILFDPDHPGGLVWSDNIQIEVRS